MRWRNPRMGPHHSSRRRSRRRCGRSPTASRSTGRRDAMRCPYCGNPDTQVKDSRPSEDNTAIRRRRVCEDCGGRFTTFERVQLRELTVVKKNGRRVPFDRDKLLRAVSMALRKRSVDPERVDRMVNGIVRQLESSGEGEVPSERIGLLAMEGLKGLDEVAYVRFASVYRNFKGTEDFNELLGEVYGDGPEGKNLSLIHISAP